VALCQRCNKRESLVTIGGRRLCEVCARDEIVKRIRREIHNIKLFNYSDEVAVLTKEPLDGISKVLAYIINRACYRCKLKVDVIELPADENCKNINDYIWSYIIEGKKLQKYKVKVLPFFSDFFLSYMIYSISTKDFSYLSIINLVKKIDDSYFFLPLFSVPLEELKGFVEIKELKFQDELFNTIFNWVRSELSENQELFHAYLSSLKLFGYKECKSCSAFIIDGEEYCARCKKFLASPSPPYLI
jgi:hypothetical protein